MKNKYNLIVILLSLFPLQFTYGQHLGQGTILEKTLIVDGIDREFLLYVPADYDGTKPWPLVINYHGFLNQAADQIYVSGMNVIADTAHFLMAYPQGLYVENPLNPEGDPGPGWNIGGTFSKNDDVAFTLKIISTIDDEYAINPERLYATGWSMGSSMSFEVACMLPDKIAAVAGVAGQMTIFQLDNCKPTRSTPTLMIHGDSDHIAPIGGFRDLFPAVKEVIDFWSNSNNCPLESETSIFEDIDKNDSSTVSLTKYTNCDRGTEVLFYTIDGGGHTWPGGGQLPPFLGNLNRDINASAEIWDFFSKFTLTDLATLPKIEEFILVDAVEDYELTVLENNAKINLVTLDKERLSIVANSSSPNIASVKMELSGPISHEQIENVVPYSLFGDKNSNYNGKKLPIGTYTLKVSPFEGKNLEGNMGLRSFLTFEVVRDTFISEFVLIDAYTDQELMTLEDGGIINLNETGNKLNVKANVYPEQVGSIEFIFDSSSRIENVKPYALFGDSNGDFFVGNFSFGEHLITANAYEKPNANGRIVSSYEIGFEVIGTIEGKRLSRLLQNEPNPFGEETTLRAFIQKDVKNAELIIFNSTGILVQKFDIVERGNIDITPQFKFPKKGFYYYKLIINGITVDSKKMISR